MLFRSHAVVDAPSFRYRPEDRLPRGSMLYRPAGSRAAQHVEEFLLREGVASFYPDLDAMFFSCGAPRRQMERAGINVPRAVPVATSDGELLADVVERLGGFPVVVKVGGEGGVGVMCADSMPVLRALLDHLCRSTVPELSAFVPDAMHHRVIVVGDRAVATYKNPIAEDDFRSAPSDERADYSADVPPELARLALAAARAIRVELAGVDILSHASGRLYVLEANFPCFFAQATIGGGLDVAGPMVDWLLRKAQAPA